MAVSVRDYVAATLRAEIARRGLTQRQVAEKCGKSQPWVSDRVTGQTTCDVEDLELLATALDVHISAFLPAPERVA